MLELFSAIYLFINRAEFYEAHALIAEWRHVFKCYALLLACFIQDNAQLSGMLLRFEMFGVTSYRGCLFAANIFLSEFLPRVLADTQLQNDKAAGMHFYFLFFAALCSGQK